MRARAPGLLNSPRPASSPREGWDDRDGADGGDGDGRGRRWPTRPRPRPRPRSSRDPEPPSRDDRERRAREDLPPLPADALAELDAQNLTLAQARARADEASGVAAPGARRRSFRRCPPAASYTRNSDEAVVALPAAARHAAARADRDPAARAARRHGRGARAPRRPVRLVRRSPPRGAPPAPRRSRRRGGAPRSCGPGSRRRRTARARRRRWSPPRSEPSRARPSSRGAPSAAWRPGTAAPLDALRARTEQVRRESDLVRARAELGGARLALGILLGREGPVRVMVPDARRGAGGRPTSATPLGRGALTARARSSPRSARRWTPPRRRCARAWARLAPQLSASASVFARGRALPDRREGRLARHGGPHLAALRRRAPLREAPRRREAQLAARARRRGGAAARGRAGGRGRRARPRGRARAAPARRDAARGSPSDAAASARRSFEAGVASSLDVIDANDRLYLGGRGARRRARARLAQARDRARPRPRPRRPLERRRCGARGARAYVLGPTRRRPCPRPPATARSSTRSCRGSSAGWPARGSSRCRRSSRSRSGSLWVEPATWRRARSSPAVAVAVAFFVVGVGALAPARVHARRGPAEPLGRDRRADRSSPFATGGLASPFLYVAVPLGMISGVFVAVAARACVARRRARSPRSWTLAALGLDRRVPDLNLVAFGGGAAPRGPPAVDLYTHAAMLSLVFVFASRRRPRGALVVRPDGPARRSRRSRSRSRRTPSAPRS